MIYDVIVIGGGPAGLMAANIFEQQHLNYLLLEKNEKPGKKLLITGGRRCNVTNRYNVNEFIANLTLPHKRFLYGALSEFGPKEVIEHFKKNGLNLVLEDNFKYFPETGKSSSVLEVLQSKINQQRLMCGQFVKEIHQIDDCFLIKTNQTSFQAKYVVVATGSNSYPSMGSNGDGLIFAKYLGIESVPFTPAETHVYAKQVSKEYAELQGVSIKNTKVTIKGTKILHQGDLLFTHFGLSGPVILHLSEFIYDEILKGNSQVSFGLVDLSEKEILEILEIEKRKNTQILKILENLTTKRLAKVILEKLEITPKNINEISKKDLNKMIDMILNFTITIDRVEDKEKAYVNRGGILTSELDPSSMESKKVKGIYFIGETVDLHGPIGGFNITIAMSTGYRCAKSIISKLSSRKDAIK
jgi:predicted Rossmann fold flavoprotein